MRKELVFAIVAGSIFGLILAFGIWRINSALSPKKEEVKTNEIKTENSVISVAKPSENDVIGVSPATLTGITKPGAIVIISAEEHDYLVVADNKGAFSEEVALVGGVNQIVTSAFAANGVSGEQKITLVYSTEFAKPTEAPEKTPESTDSIRQKVQEKVQEALNSPTSYTGTVTDISADSIQLKTTSGDIAQVATNNSPTVVKDGKTQKTVKIADIAIGDYIVAMGYRNGNHVLAAERILITSQLTSTGRKALYGNIASTSKSGLTLETKDGDKEILASSTTVVYLVKGEEFTKKKFSTLEEGNLIVAVVDTLNKNTARTIFAIASE